MSQFNITNYPNNEINLSNHMHNSSKAVYLGLETLEYLLKNNQKKNYPPYNLIQINSHEHLIEIAVAGFSQKELKIQICGTYLYITGKKTQNHNHKYIYKGIATRSFEKQFILSNNGKIRGVSLKEGILQIVIFYPRAQELKSIPIENHSL